MVVFLVQVDWVVGWKISEREFGFLVKAESMGEESVVSSPYQVLELKQSIRQPAWAGDMGKYITIYVVSTSSLTG